MENKRKHLELIQAIISRMANNAFLLKGWSVTLVAALMALGAHDAQRSFMIVAYLPVVAFWSLDGYFLSLERCFRSLYDHVSVLDEKQIDYSMDIAEQKKIARNTWGCALFSPSSVVFYLVLAFSMLIVMYLVK